MSKPCPRCGQLTEEQYAFCCGCGYPLTPNNRPPVVVQPAVPVQPASQQPKPAIQPPVVQTQATAPLKKKNPAGVLIAVGAVTVIVIIAAILVLIFLGGGMSKAQSPQQALDRLIDAALDGDMEKAMNCIYEYRYSDELRQEALESMDNGYDFSLEEFGIDKDTVKSMLSFKVGEIETAGPQDDAAIREDLFENGIPTDPIESIVRAKVTMTLFGESDTTDMFFIKADGGWYLLASGGGGEDFALGLNQ